MGLYATTGPARTVTVRHRLHWALAALPVDCLDLPAANLERDCVTYLRSGCMQPEHRAWIDCIWGLRDPATSAVLQPRAGSAS